MQINDQTTAAVSGGASGLGKAVAKQLARREAKVTFFDCNREKGKQLSGEIGVDFVHCDVADSAAVTQSLAQAREKNWQERVCVNCAGIAFAAKTISWGEAHDPDQFAKVIGINFSGDISHGEPVGIGNEQAGAFERAGTRSDCQ